MLAHFYKKTDCSAGFSRAEDVKPLICIFLENCTQKEDPFPGPLISISLHIIFCSNEYF